MTFTLTPIAHLLVDDFEFEGGIELKALFVDGVEVTIERLRKLTLNPPPQRPRQLKIQTSGTSARGICWVLVRSGLGPPAAGALLIKETVIEGNRVAPGPGVAGAVFVGSSAPHDPTPLAALAAAAIAFSDGAGDDAAVKRVLNACADYARISRARAIAAEPAEPEPATDTAFGVPDWLAGELAAERRGKP